MHAARKSRDNVRLRYTHSYRQPAASATDMEASCRCSKRKNPQYCLKRRGTSTWSIEFENSGRNSEHTSIVQLQLATGKSCFQTRHFVEEHMASSYAFGCNDRPQPTRENGTGRAPNDMLFCCFFFSKALSYLSAQPRPDPCI